MSFVSTIDITEHELLLLDKTTYILIDVRTLEEYTESHVSISRNIPLQEFLDTDITILLPKDKIVISYCKSGIRSKKTTLLLQDLGYRAYNLGSFEHLSCYFIEKLQELHNC